MSTDQNIVIHPPKEIKTYERNQKIEESREKLKPVVSKESLAKKSLKEKFEDTFLSDDLNSLTSYFVKYQLVPGIKKLALNALRYAFFHEGDDDRYDRYGDSRYNDYTSCYSYRGKGSGDRRRPEQRKDYDRGYRNDPVDYRNVKMKYAKDAEAVVDALRDRIDRSGEVSVAEFMDLIGQPSDHTDIKWGWTDTRDIGIKRLGGNSFLIDVAEAEYLG